MNPTPLHQLPKGWNANEAEGRAAFHAGDPMDSHRYGDCSAGKEFERAWRQAERMAKDI
jgi:hypothetical protein